MLADIEPLKTERLLLRIPQEIDTSIYVEFYADADASAFYSGPKPPHAAWSALAQDIGHWCLRGYGSWMLELLDTNEVVGGCGLVWPYGWPRPELTWWIMPEHRQKGYAKEASKAVISYGYEVLGWDLVQTHMKDENLAAKKLVQSLGGTLISREMFPDKISRNVYKLPQPKKV